MRGVCRTCRSWWKWGPTTSLGLGDVLRPKLWLEKFPVATWECLEDFLYSQISLVTHSIISIIDCELDLAKFKLCFFRFSLLFATDHAWVLGCFLLVFRGPILRRCSTRQPDPGEPTDPTGHRAAVSGCEVHRQLALSAGSVDPLQPMRRCQSGVGILQLCRKLLGVSTMGKTWIMLPIGFNRIQ